jgi:hypothetical protein
MTSMSFTARRLSLAVLLVAIPGIYGCSASQTPATRYDQLVRCDVVTAVVGGALPPAFPNAARIRAATGRIAQALAKEAEASGKTAPEVVNDLKAAATRLEALARDGNPDGDGKRLVEEATRCIDLVPA